MAGIKDALKKGKEYLIDDTLNDFKKIGNNINKPLKNKGKGDTPKKEKEAKDTPNAKIIKQIIVVKCMACPNSKIEGEELGDNAQIICDTIGAKGNGFVSTLGDGLETPIPDWCPLNDYEGDIDVSD